MAVQWADDFKIWGDDETAMTAGVYSEVDSNFYLTTDPDPNAAAGSRCLACFGSGPSIDNVIRHSFISGAAQTMGVAVRIWIPTLPVATDRSIDIFSLRDIANTVHVTLSLETTGHLSILRGGEGGTNLGTSTLPVIVAGAWNHVEFKCKIDNATGTTEVRVNGREVAGLTLTSQDTQNSANATAAQVAIVHRRSASNSGTNFYIRDFIVWDTTGTENTSFLGSVSVLSLAPTSDVSFNWTASTGSTGYNLIDEFGPNDTDYISATPAQTTASEFGFENLPSDATTVKALLTVGRIKKTDGGDATVQMGLKSGASTDLGADRTITTNFAYWWDVSELDPNTSTSWTPTTANAATVTIDRTT